MIRAPTREEWEKIHKKRAIFVADCWKTCEGFCCSTKHKFFKFRAITSGQIFVPMLCSEFDYLNSIGKLQPGMEKMKHVFSHSFPDGQEAKLILARCKQAGNCLNSDFRPFICKIAPFLPDPDDDGNVNGFSLCNIFDATFHHIGLKSPCTLLEQKKQEMQDSSIEFTKEIIKHPYFIFYFKAASLILELYKKGMLKNLDNAAKMEPEDFFRKWEGLYLTNKLIDKNELCLNLDLLYFHMNEKFGPFEV